MSLSETMADPDELHDRVLSQMAAAAGLGAGAGSGAAGSGAAGLAGATGSGSHGVPAEDDLIGFFQTFRPDGTGLDGVFEPLAVADALHDRLERLFEVAGEDRRPQGGRDAYFIVRQPRPIDPEVVRQAGRSWIDAMISLAKIVGQTDAAATLAGVETIRVLEGTAPKNPRSDDEKSSVLKVLLNEVPNWLDRFAGDDRLIARLRGPYYFISCDPMLRDHLMWPLVAHRFEIRDPFQSYFELWRHGVKYRSYRDDQIDLYMPRLTT